VEHGARGGLLSAGIGATAGVLGVLWSPVLVPWILFAAWLPIALLCPARLRWPQLWLLLAASWTLWHATTALEARWPAARHGIDITLRGHVTDLPQHRADHWRFRFEPVSGEAVTGAVRTSWYRTEEVLAAGDCWLLTLRMRAPRGSVSPGAFDYERWLFAEGYAASAYVRQGKPCADAEAPAWWRQARQGLDTRLGIWLADHPALDFTRALTVANRNGLDDEDWHVLRVTGTSHLVAISGLHVGLVAGLFLFLGAWLWRRSALLCGLLPAPRAGVLAGTVAACGYAALAGFSVPTQRALLMWVVVALALWSGHRVRAWHVLMLAWMVVLAFDPFAVLGAGAWLSFVAVGTIVLVSSERAGGAGVWWRIPRLQAALLIGLAPATLLFFDGASVLAPFVNALVIPVFAVLLPVLLASVVVAWLGLGTLPLSITADGLQWLREGLAVLAETAPFLWLEAAPSALAIACAAVGAVLLLAPQAVPLRLLGVICWLPLFWPRPDLPPGMADVAVLDVGQGLSVVVRTRHHTLVYDAGPAWPGGFDAGQAIVLPYLRESGARRIDHLMLSHNHRDHIGGADAIARALPVEQRSGVGGGAVPCRASQQWRWDGVQFSVLHPRVADAWRGNNRSCVLRVQAGAHRLLIAGDIEAAAERRMLAAGEAAFAADAIVVPHHGSQTSSTPAFVGAVQPDWATVSAGWQNRHGHPHPDIVARWRGVGAKVITTGNSGTLTMRLGESEPPLPRAARAQRRFWRAPTPAIPPYSLVGLGASP